MRLADRQPNRGKKGVSISDLDLAIVGLRDQVRLEGASNYVIWKSKMSFLLDEFHLKIYANNVVAVPQDVDQLKGYRKEMVKVKQLILDGVQDHIISLLADKGMTKAMWDSLA